MPERPLTILQVASGMPNFGGAELHLLALSEQLTQRGHTVHILARPGSYVFEEGTRRGLTVHSGTVHSQSDFSAFGRLQPVFARTRYDILHVHMFPDHLVPPAVARHVKVPVNIMTHHLPHPLKKGLLKRLAIRRFLFNRVIAVSESVRQTLLTSGLAPEQVVTIHHGTDTEAFRQITVSREEIRREWGIPAETFVLGIAGRVAEEKGVDHFLQAMKQIRHTGIHGVVIGAGDTLPQMRELADRLNLNDRVTFAGFRSDINNAINALDCLVLASTWAEPCAAVVQQAMALGLPVIGTDIGGTPEMIEEGTTGFLVQPSQPEAIVAAVERLLSDSAAPVRMGEAGRRRVDALFTLSGMVDKTEALYREEWTRCGGR